METQSLSNWQLELLRVYSREVDQDDVLAIRKLLANYFAEKAIGMADKVWDENSWKKSYTEQLSQEHNRKLTKS